MNQKMLSYGRKTNEMLHHYFQTGNKKQMLEEFMKWTLIEQAKYEQMKKDKIEAELIKKNDEKEKPLSKRERTRINKALKLEQKKKEEALKKTEQEILPEVKKVRAKKEKVEREKAIYIKDYQFQANDVVRLKDGNAKGFIEKIEKNIATINYGLFTAKTAVDQLELVKKAK